MAFTADGRFNFITAQGRHLFKKNTFTVSTLPRARLEPPRSPKPLTVGSQDSCCSRRSRRLTLQPFESDSKKHEFLRNLLFKRSDFHSINPIMKLTQLWLVKNDASSELLTCSPYLYKKTSVNFLHLSQ